VEPTRLATLAGLLLLVGQTILRISDSRVKPGGLRPVNGCVVKGRSPAGLVAPIVQVEAAEAEKRRGGAHDEEIADAEVPRRLDAVT